MKGNIYLAGSLLLLCFAVTATAQSTPASGTAKAASAETGPIRSSAAYAEVLLRKTEIQAEIASVADAYTDENPRMKDMRAELASLEKSISRMFGVKPTDTGKLSAALGKLIVKKASLESDLTRLSRSYSADHQEVKRAKRRIEIFESAISEILK
jgi:uncharacterized protein involved in exopolysaccharide biosynthesis